MVVMAVIVPVIILVFMVTAGFPGEFYGFALIFIALFVIFTLVAASGAFRGTGTQGYAPPPPPPPPIQQPMVPAGLQGPVPLNCPNCGAPPANIDRFGVATCEHCETRYLVR